MRGCFQRVGRSIKSSWRVRLKAGRVAGLAHRLQPVGHPLGIAVLAAGADLGAAGDRVPGHVGPLNGCLVATVPPSTNSTERTFSSGNVSLVRRAFPWSTQIRSRFSSSFSIDFRIRERSFVQRVVVKRCPAVSAPEMSA